MLKSNFEKDNFKSNILLIKIEKTYYILWNVYRKL